MYTKRVIPCLDVKNGRVVKGVNFVNFKDAGDPAEVGAAYDKSGADELVFLDITASSDARATAVEMVRKVAEKVFIPFTVGGGIRTVDDFKAILRVTRMLDLPSQVRRRKPYRHYQQAVHKYPNLLQRAFAQPFPDRFWVTDITYILTATVAKCGMSSSRPYHKNQR